MLFVGSAAAGARARATRHGSALSACPFARDRLPALVWITPNGCSSSAESRVATTRRAVQLVKAGVSAVQLRDYSASADQFKQCAELLKFSVGDSLVVNVGCPGGVHAAGAVQASVGHVPEHFLDNFLGLKDDLSSSLTFGVSVHSVNAAQIAVDSGAAYVQVGTMFETASHPDKVLEGPQLLHDIRRALGRDIVALGVGGVTSENADQLIAAGADGVAVISGFTGPKTPASIVARYWAALRRGTSVRDQTGPLAQSG